MPSWTTAQWDAWTARHNSAWIPPAARGAPWRRDRTEPTKTETKLVAEIREKKAAIIAETSSTTPRKSKTLFVDLEKPEVIAETTQVAATTTSDSAQKQAEVQIKHIKGLLATLEPPEVEMRKLLVDRLTAARETARSSLPTQEAIDEVVQALAEAEVKSDRASMHH